MNCLIRVFSLSLVILIFKLVSPLVKPASNTKYDRTSWTHHLSAIKNVRLVEDIVSTVHSRESHLNIGHIEKASHS